MSVSDLPTVNAALNLTSATLLLLGLLQIRRGRVRRHRACMLGAFASSMAFLVSYSAYHYAAGVRHFTGQGMIRPVYFALLTSHTILAAAVVPLVLVTLFRALGGRYRSHRSAARWTLPIWMYVSVTGILIYLMLYHPV
jgi:putative membrane protein